MSSPDFNLFEDDMKDEFTALVRREQTQQQLELVCGTITKELEEFVQVDELGLHKTQLNSVRGVLNTAITELGTHLAKIKVEALEMEEVYDACRDYDEAIIWLQRLWDYLREKLEQRNENKNEALAQLLKSADEVVWSCFHGTLKNAGKGHGPAPLTYIEPEYSPATIQTDKPLPVSLMLTADLAFLDECLQSLPIPVLRLPPTCVSSPWWLVFIGHEVGHHVQYALDLVAYFREGMRTAAESVGYAKEDAAASWGNWGEEIFADLFSIMMMGPWALRAIAEIETGSIAKMVKRKSTYPAPVIRLALMKATAEQLGLDTTKALIGLDLKQIAETDPICKKDFGVVAPAVSFALQDLPGGLGRLEELCSFKVTSFGEMGTISGWASSLTAKDSVPADKEIMERLETARQIVCGSLQAWSKHAEGTNSCNEKVDYTKRSEKRETIKQNTIAALLKSGPRETRAGTAASEAKTEEAGKTLADLLRKASRRATAMGGTSGAV